MTPERWQQIEQAYHLALQRDGDERAAFLEEACRGDQQMRREIESLLRHTEPAEGFMEASGLAVAAHALAQDRQGSMLGRQIGAYQIISLVGAGGMGEVYRARDTRLDRIVALKILPEHLSSKRQVRERFEREARAISALNHPHICTLHDIGNQDGTDYLVMEYLEGETLAHQLKKGPLPVEPVLRYGIQMFDALDTAHRRGVIHRDLKPSNIMLTKTGVKLLDFGLAKAPEARVAGVTARATQTPPLTGEGTILGTLQYMAPEQLQGAEADARTDIFALGAVLYEMATGQRAFQGKSQADLIAATLERNPPPISTLQPLSPPGLDHVVQTCLAKEPDARWQTAHDVLLQLKWIAETGSQAVNSRPKATRLKNREVLSWLLTTAVLLAFLILAAVHFRPSSTAHPVRFQVSIPGGKPLGECVPSLSPDGRWVAFTTANPDYTRQLWIHSLDSGATRLVPGIEASPESPFWSPDSRFLAFIDTKDMPNKTAYHLKKIDVMGGLPQTICDTDNGFNGGTWGRDGAILFSQGKVPPFKTTPFTLTGFPQQAGKWSPFCLSTNHGRKRRKYHRSSYRMDGISFIFRSLRIRRKTRSILVRWIRKRPASSYLSTQTYGTPGDF